MNPDPRDLEESPATMTTIDPKHTTTPTPTTTPAPAHDVASPPPSVRSAVNDNAHTDAGNDNALERGGADTTSLVAHADFVACVRGTLVRHGRRKSLEDDILEVQIRALAAARSGPMPGDLARWKALGRVVAKLYAIDERRRWEVRKKYDEGLCEDPDAHGPIEVERGRDPVDTKPYLAVLKDQFDRDEMPDMGGEILWDTAEDIPQEETAAETGLSERQVRFRLRQMRVRAAPRRPRPARALTYRVRQVDPEVVSQIGWFTTR